MISYKIITIEDRQWIQDKIKESNFRGSEYCFTNQLLWGETVGMQVAEVENQLCTVYLSMKECRVHDFPVGHGDKLKAIQALIEDDKQYGQKTCFRGVLEEEKQWLESNFSGKFEFESRRGEWDYLYSANDLALLAGRKFHGKRNHIARFQADNDWSYEKICRENIPEVLGMYEEWFEQSKERLADSAEIEKDVVYKSFQYFEELQLEGGLLKKQGKVVAFSVGETLNSDTYIVHLEKAFSDIQGAYPMINQQFVLHNMQGLQYINREDDMNIEGLRKAKLSYNPVILLEKYCAKLD